MIAQTRVETIGRCLPPESGKFCTLFYKYVSLLIDDPVLAQPIRANLFRSTDDHATWVLNWNRPPKRGERD